MRMGVGARRWGGLVPAVAAVLGLGGAAMAQQAAPGIPAQQVNPSPMPPGTAAGNAPGMGGAAERSPGAPAGALNPSPMPPGSTAGTAPGMSPGPQPVRPEGGVVVKGLGRPGGTGIHAPDAQPDVVPVAPATGVTAPPAGAVGGGAERMEVGPRRPLPPLADGTAGPLESGANSFTAEQAAERIAAAGFNDVQILQLDANGIWRGRAIRNGVPTEVALDFRGNIAATR